MKGIRVDPVAQTVALKAAVPGAMSITPPTLLGWRPPASIISSTNRRQGLTLGGGLGHLTRKCGLTIDNLLEADMVRRRQLCHELTSKIIRSLLGDPWRRQLWRGHLLPLPTASYRYGDRRAHALAVGSGQGGDAKWYRGFIADAPDVNVFCLPDYFSRSAFPRTAPAEHVWDCLVLHR
ncbi:MAG: hypothetical protein R2867_32750 [Caldilineaceae bacterium]